MQKYGGAADGGSNIRFSLLAIVDGVYEKASDEWAFRKKERAVLERRLCDMSDGGQGWQSMVDPELWNAAGHAFGENDAFQHNNVFAHDFGARKMERDREILEMGSEEQLLRAWEECVKSAMRAKVAVEDELTKAQRDHVRLWDSRFISTLFGADDVIDGPCKTKLRLRAIPHRIHQVPKTRGSAQCATRPG